MDQFPAAEVAIYGLVSYPVSGLLFALTEHLPEATCHLFGVYFGHFDLPTALLEELWLGLHLIRVLQQFVGQIMTVFATEHFGLGLQVDLRRHLPSSVLGGGGALSVHEGLRGDVALRGTVITFRVMGLASLE